GIFAAKNAESRLPVSSIAHFVGCDCVGYGSPGSASPSPGASTLSACFAGWLTHHRDTENTERFQITGRVVPAVELLSRLCGRRTQLLPKFEALHFSGGRVR